MGVPLNVIDYRCFWKAVSAMQKAEYQVNSTIIESYSAGTETKPQINQDAVRIMKEIYGIDMEANGQYSKLITDIPDVDIAISMGCNVGCPFIGRAFDDNWGLDDPTGKSDDDFKAVMQRIEENIFELKKRLSENK